MNHLSWQFSTKGETLNALCGQLQHADVLPLRLVSREQFDQFTHSQLGEIFKQLDCNELVVRSSYSAEDSETASCAGAFKTVLHVSTAEALQQAIRDVFDSYPRSHNINEHVLVQPMLLHVKHCGVLFTRDQSSQAPYWMVTDDKSGKTDTVTSGVEASTETYVIRHGGKTRQAWLNQLIDLAQELMLGFEQDLLDIEYAIDSSNQLYLLQVRPLIVAGKEACFTPDLIPVHDKLNKMMQAHPFLYGDTTVFGVMPDWNPAEIIGLYPKPLALSLYKSLITDSTWAYQRNNYGYRNLRSFPLMIDFLGLPYIDVRVSFNSFLPKDIAPDLGNKLVNYYLAQLKANPRNHDSVEFDIVLSCYTPSINSRIEELLEAGFSQAECQQLATHLLSLTNRIIDPRTGLWIQDLHRIEKLKQRQKEAKLGIEDPVSRIYWLLEDCKRYGTLPFAGLARAAFIAIQMLQALVENNVISENDYHAFLSSLNTVSGQMQSDLSHLEQDAFLDEYGHLRPGTYDLCSPRYDAAPERYFNFNSANVVLSPSKPKPSKCDVGLASKAYARINQVLLEHGINHSADSLLHFMKSAIEGREYAKFVFTRSLSDAMEEFSNLGAQYGLSRDDMAYADINVIYNLMTSSQDIESCLKNSIVAGKSAYQTALQIKLPSLLVSPDEVYCFKVSEAQPSFVTQERVYAEVVECRQGADYEGKVVLIRSADPGYDWLFTHNIKGFVTAFGGVNSHMAIRAAELNIPAVIGAGEVLFERWRAARSLEIDCLSQNVRIIS